MKCFDNYNNPLIRTLILTFIVFMSYMYSATDALSSIYYVNGSVVDDSGTGSEVSPKKHLQSAIALMTGGDTVIIEDGTYKGVLNTIIVGVNTQPPSGSELAGYTTIKARNPGKVILDGEGVRRLIDLNARNYLQFDGIVFMNAGGGNGGELFFAMGTSSSNYSNHLKITRCGFCEVPDTTGGSGFRWNLLNLRYYEYFLIEDCYAWGNGKYRYYILDCRKGVLRRCVDRIDRSTDNDVASYGNLGSVRLYNSNDILVQNQILIDSDQISQYLDPLATNTLGHPAMFFSDGPDTSAIVSNNIVVGAIGVNNTGARVWFHANDLDYNIDKIYNSVFWKFADGIRNREISNTDYIKISNSLFGYILGSYGSMFTESGYGINVRNSIIIYNSIGVNSYKSNSAISDLNYYNGNQKNFNNLATPGVNDTITINPLTNGLKYIVRIEPKSLLNIANVGPNIDYQFGVTGTLYGDAGYDILTDVPLWPFPYEDTIRENMRNYALHGVDGKRGFCADGQTLTKYIWRYLGNPLPPSYLKRNN